MTRQTEEAAQARIPRSRMIEMPEPASRYLGLRCDSVSLDGLRCTRNAGHAEVRGRTGQLHRADANGVPAVWGDRR